MDDEFTMTEPSLEAYVIVVIGTRYFSGFTENGTLRTTAFLARASFFASTDPAADRELRQVMEAYVKAAGEPHFVKVAVLAGTLRTKGTP